MTRNTAVASATLGTVLCVGLLLGACTSDGSSPSPPPNPAVTASVTKPVVTPTAAADHTVACTSADITASVGKTGDAAGTGITDILFTNVGETPCRLGGVPTLSGVTVSGKATVLAFQGTTDRARALQPDKGPGVLRPGDKGLIIVSMQLNNCVRSAAPYKGYKFLRIDFPHGGASLSLAYPAPLAVTGCPAYVSGAGLGDT